MELRRARLSDTVTRYFVSGRVGPRWRVLIVRPDDRGISAVWRTGDHGDHLDAEWVSSHPDLEAWIDHLDVASGPVRIIEHACWSESDGGGRLSETAGPAGSSEAADHDDCAVSTSAGSECQPTRSMRRVEWEELA
jgi:hypothetical protein